MGRGFVCENERRDRALIDCLTDCGPMSRTEIGQEIGVSPGQVLAILRRLERGDRVARDAVMIGRKVVYLWRLSEHPPPDAERMAAVAIKPSKSDEDWNDPEHDEWLKKVELQKLERERRRECSIRL